MARYTGAVRFPDSSLLYFVYNGTTGTARPSLFTTAGEADQAWDAKQSCIEKPPMGLGSDDETVELMPYFCHGNDSVEFITTANRASKLITGALSIDTSIEAGDGPYF